MHRPGSSWTAAEEEWLPLADRNRGASIFTCNRKHKDAWGEITELTAT